MFSKDRTCTLMINTNLRPIIKQTLVDRTVSLYVLVACHPRRRKWFKSLIKSLSCSLRTVIGLRYVLGNSRGCHFLGTDFTEMSSLLITQNLFSLSNLEAVARK